MYCTLADIKARRLSEETIINLTDPDGLGVVGEAAVNAAITEAGETIDGYLRGRYALPLSPAPGIVRNIAVDLTVYAIYGRSSYQTPERVKDDNAAALRLLGQIQAGRVQIGAEVNTTPAVEGGGNMSVATPARIFDPSTLERY